MGVSDSGYRAGLCLGLLRAGLGRLVVLGSGGERLVYAMAGGDGAAALPGGHRETRELPGLDRAAGDCRLSLCLLGTFPVRSGVLVSVHSFASDPTRGLFILALLVVAIGGSLLLYALKGTGAGAGRTYAVVARVVSAGEQYFADRRHAGGAARHAAPLVHKELGLGSISIGEPFFNLLFTALMAPFALLLGVGPLIRWRRDQPGKQLKRLAMALLVTLSLSLLLPWLLQDRIVAMAVLGLMMAIWVLLFALIEIHERATHRHGFWRGLRVISRSQWGMVLGHVGVAVTVIGITFSQNYSIERDVRMKTGDSIDIHRYHFVFDGCATSSARTGPAAKGDYGDAQRSPGSHAVRGKTVLQRQPHDDDRSGDRRRFDARSVCRAGEELEDGSWAVRLYYKPFVRWIWFGGGLMALGGLCCMLDPRYRMRKQRQEAP